MSHTQNPDRSALNLNIIFSKIKSYPYLFIFLAGLALRFFYLIQARQNNPLIDYIILDARQYWNLAMDILHGQYLPTFISYTPVYPYYIAFFLYFLKTKLLVFAAFHLIGCFQAIVIGKIAEEIASRREGIIAALIAATYWPFIIFEGAFHSENLTLIAVSLGLLLFIRAKKERVIGFIDSSVCLTIAAMARANLFLFVFGISFVQFLSVVKHLLSKKYENISTSIKTAVAFIIPVVLIVGPLLLWNYHLSGRFILRYQGSLSVFVGNNPDFNGLVPRGGVEWWSLASEAIADGYASEASQQEYWSNRTWRIIKERPGEWFRLNFKKLLMNLNRFEVSQEFSIPYYRDSSPALSLPWPGAGMVLPLGITGIFLVGFSSRKTKILSWFVIIYFFSIMPVQVSARYRLPMFPVLIVFSSIAMAAFFDYIRKKEWKSLITYGSIAVIGFAISIPDHLNLTQKDIIYTTTQIGNKAYFVSKDNDEAARYYETALLLHDDDYNAMYHMSHILFSRGRIKEAKQLLEKILKKVNFAEALCLRAQIYKAEGNMSKARQSFTEALKLKPSLRDTEDFILLQKSLE